MSGKGFDFIGVVEGFYGPVWDPVVRYWFIEQLVPFGLNTYLYAPKNEPVLAGEALRSLSELEADRLADFAGFCGERGIRLWAGLHLEPPFDPMRPDHIESLAMKIVALGDLGFSGFALLFDDISHTPEGLEGEGALSLAKVQAQAFTATRAEVEATGVRPTWLVCPSRYSLDPILEKEYGALPADYLSDLDAGMASDVYWLWTGPKVVPQTITLADRDAYLNGLKRPLILWDNYPVNDVAMTASLHLQPLSGRGPDLHAGVAGYLFNPLLQGSLGTVPGATCLQYAHDPKHYDPEVAWDKALKALVPPEARESFAVLEALTRRSALANNPRSRHPLASDLAGRLQTAYATGVLPVNPDLLKELDAQVANLCHHLAPEWLEEAQPWLSRLGNALEYLRAGQNDTRARALAQYQAGQAFVLGPWFKPE